jgi:hypothetical protein
LLSASKVYPKEKLDKMKETYNVSQISDVMYDNFVIKAKIDKDSLIQLELEVFSFNRHGFYETYPKYYYYLKYDLQRKVYLVSGITSNSPYFIYDRMPGWVEESKLDVKLEKHQD